MEEIVKKIEKFEKINSSLVEYLIDVIPTLENNKERAILREVLSRLEFEM